MVARPRRRRARVPQRLPAPRRAAVHRGRGRGAPVLPVPVPRLDLRPRRQAGRRAEPRPKMPDIDRVAFGLLPVAVREWLGYAWVCLADEPPSFEDTVVARRSPSGSATRRDRRPLRHRRPGGRPPDHLRRRGELEADRRELHGVLPLRDDPPRAHRGAPGVRRRATRRSTSWATGRSSATEVAGFTVDGSAGLRAAPRRRPPTRTAATTRSRSSPQVFVNLVPDHVIVPPHVPGRRGAHDRRCDWLYLPEVVASGADLDRSVELFHRVNQQDFEACERCQLVDGLALLRPRRRPGAQRAPHRRVPRLGPRTRRLSARTPSISRKQTTS